MTRISIQPLDNYEPDGVAEALEHLLAPLGTIRNFISESDRVTLKPNMLAPKPVERAVTTHPEIIRQVARMCSEACAKPVTVTDCPGVGTAKLCATKMGLLDTDYMRVVSGQDARWLDAPTHGLPKLHVSNAILDGGVIINLPKAKTHGQMVLTAAVKNTFGAVVGLEKAQWHYRIGRNPESFAKLLVHIHQMVSPKLSILDSVIGMEGNGPGSGTPRQLGFLMAGENAHAMDLALCKILGVDPMSVYTIRAAKDLGLLPSWKDVEVHGDLERLRPQPKWKMATPKGVARMIGPNWMTPLWERLLKTAPRVSHGICTMCMECHKQCAAQAIDVKAGRIEIDSGACISCFCCQEMCPHGAIEVEAGILARLLGLGED